MRMQLCSRLRGLGLLLVLLSACAPLLAAGKSSEESVREALAKGKWADTITAAKSWRQSDPTSAVASWLIGYASLVERDYGNATDAFAALDGPHAASTLAEWSRTLAQDNPEVGLVLLLRGDALARTGDLEAALRALDEAAQQAPNEALVYDVRGTIRALSGRSEDATADFGKAIELDAKRADAYLGLGLLRLQQGDADGAVEALSQAIELAPVFALAYNARACAWLQQELWEQAEADFARGRELAGNLAYIAGNAALAERAKADASFRRALLTRSSDGRGTTLMVQSWERHSHDLGDGRSIDYVIVKDTPETATLEGMRAVMRDVLREVRREPGLEQWQPQSVMVAIHGMGSSPIQEMERACRVAYNAGSDLVITFDNSGHFATGNVLTLDRGRAEREFQAATGLVARGNAAINLEYGVMPSGLANSQGVRTVAVKMGEMYEQGTLEKGVRQSLRWDRLVCTGAPLELMKIPQRYEQDCIREGVLNLTTKRTASDLLGSHPLTGINVTNVELTDLGKAVAHSAWNDVRWGNRLNPTLEPAALFLRGGSVTQVAEIAQRQASKGEIPIYTAPLNAPSRTIPLTMIEMTQKVAPTGAVLIGCADLDLGNAMARQCGNGWRAKVVPETDLAKLQQMARAEGFSHINRVADVALDSSTEQVSQRTPSVSLPELRTIGKNLDRFYDAARLLSELSNNPLPPDMKTELAFAGSALKDLQSAREGTYNPLTSEMLERIGRFGMQQLPQCVDLLKQNGSLSPSYNLPPLLAGLPDITAGAASQVGRGQSNPSIQEVTLYLDGLNKACWATVGSLVGGPKGAAVGSIAGGMAADWGREISRGAIETTYQDLALQPDRQRLVGEFRTQVEAATARGLQAKTLSQMFTPQVLMQMGFETSTIAELDSYAKWANTTASDRDLSRAIPSINVPQFQPVFEDNSRKFFFPPPPPPPPGGAAIDPGSGYRLPAAALPQNDRGGVLMRTEVVVGQPVEGGPFASKQDQRATEMASTQQGFVAPLLLFCATPKTSGG